MRTFAGPAHVVRVVHSVPFTIEPSVDDVMRGILSIRGVLRFDGGTLELEFQTTNMRLTRSSVHARSFPLDDLAAVEYRRRFFSPRLRVVAHRLTVFQDMPGAQGGTLVLAIAWGQRAAASRAAWDLQAALENRKLPSRRA